MKRPVFANFAGLIALAALFSACGITRSDAADSARNSPTVKVIKEWSGSVVNIATEHVVAFQQQPYWRAYGTAFDEFFRQYSQQTVNTMKVKGIGSGIIVSESGLIVTNVHVIKMASKVYVVFSDGTTAEALLAATSPKDDIAILKIAIQRELKPVKFADGVIIGETVVSIGNAFGLENSVSSGIVSGTNRGFTLPDGFTYNGLIQTDSPINIGSSGGALFNLDGELAGMNLAVLQGAQSIGFAIPSTRIKDILKQYDDYLEKNRNAIPKS
jgi:serine protease Do